MIFPDCCDSLLTLPPSSSAQTVISVVSNCEHSVVVIATSMSLYFYYSDTRLLVCAIHRTQEEVEERGFFTRIYWKPDSTAICATTANNFLSIYSVEFVRTHSTFNLHDPVDGEAGRQFARVSSEFFIVAKRECEVQLRVVAKLEAKPTCVLSLKEELILCLTDGWLHRLSWTGQVLPELSFNLWSSFVSNEHKQHNNLPQADLRHHSFQFVVDIAPFLGGGICCVFDNGIAALLTSNSSNNFSPDSITFSWAIGLADATCCATNSRFRVIYFGCKNGDVAGYSLDDLNGTLIQIFRVHLAVKNGTEFVDRFSGVRQIRCLTNRWGNAIAVIWNCKVFDKQTAMEPINQFEDDISKNNDREERIAADKTIGVKCRQKICPPTLAIFSPFGEQWWCSLEDNFVEECSSLSSFDPSPNQRHFYTTMDWALDGYQLWLGTTNAGIQLINLIKSMPNTHQHLLMCGADRVYLCRNDGNVDMANKESAAPAHLVWQQLKPPTTYIQPNLPIKHIALDSDSIKVLVLAGLHGFCFYNLKTNKWRIFRKEAQEKSLVVTGGLAVFDNFIMCSACNMEEEKDGGGDDNLYVFKVDNQLDLDLAYSVPTSRVLQIALCGSHLLMYDVNSVVSIHFLTMMKTPVPLDQFGIELDCVAEIRIADFLVDPMCLISMELAKLDFHFDSIPFCADLDTLLVNTSGHLLLLSPCKPQINNGQQTAKNGDGDNNVSELQLHPPTLVASYVEEFWTMHTASSSNRTKNNAGLNTVENSNNNNVANQQHKIPYLSGALWINAGCKKNRIWLPLLIDLVESNKSSCSDGEKHVAKKPPLVQQTSRSFISRRIMLPLAMDIYPLFIDANYLACSANCVSAQFGGRGPRATKLLMSDCEDNVSLISNKFATDDEENTAQQNGGFVGSNHCEEGPVHFTGLSIHTLVRTNEVFIHKLIKELLKRNLGTYAFELAFACRSLPYFDHILELLLHDVLDEEATCAEPIPDPLLPTVVTFLREFPDEYLQTVVHCARKTEPAFWNLLFSVSNQSRQLFQMCLQEGQLDTATSCLIIMHSLVNMRESSKLAFQLLDEALTKRRWRIAEDIVRFMQNISQATEEHDSLDDGNPVESVIAHSQQPHQVPGFTINTPPTDQLNFPLFSSQMDIGSSSSLGQQQRRRSGSGKKLVAEFVVQQPRHITAFSTTNPRRKSKSVSSPSSPPKEAKFVANNEQSKTNQPPKATTTTNGLDDANSLCLSGILTKHASNLLEDYALRDLAAFSSFLSFDLVAFFQRNENAFCIKPEDFPLVLMKLHAQFSWPYPVSIAEHLFVDSSITNNTAQSNGDLHKMPSLHSMDSALTLMSTSSTTTSLLDLPNNNTMMPNMDVKVKQVPPGDRTRFEHFIQHFTQQPTRVDEQMDAELSFLFAQLQCAQAFEWLYLLSILRREVQLGGEQISAAQRMLQDRRGGNTRFVEFLTRITDGTRELLQWAQTRCTAYTPTLNSFKHIVKQFCDDKN